MEVFVPEYMKNAYRDTEIKKGKWTKVKLYKHPYVFFFTHDPLEWSAEIWKWIDEQHVIRITPINIYGRLFTRPTPELKEFLGYVIEQLKRHDISFPNLDYDTPAQSWYQTWDEVES